MLTESCLKKYLSQPCDGDEFMSSQWELDRILKHSVPGNRSTDIAQKISRAVNFYCLGFREDCDFFSFDEYSVRVPRKLVTVFIYYAACPCLLGTALQICNSGKISQHLNFEVRVDPRLRSDCCSSLAVGVERLKFLQAANDDCTRESGINYLENVDFSGSIK